VSSCLYGHGAVERILPEIRKAGVGHVDIWPRDFGAQREQMDALGHARFAALLKKNRVGLGVLSRYDLGPFRLQEEMQIARRFGCDTMVCGAGGGGGLAGAELKVAVKDFAERMKPHLAAAEQAGVSIGIENHSGNLTASPDALKWLVELAPSKRLGIALAPYHLAQDPIRTARLIEELGDRIVFLYAWQRGHWTSQNPTKEEARQQLPGRGAMDFTPIVAALKKIGYRGWVSIFMHSVPGGLPICDTTARITEEIKLAQRYLADCLARV
jgi:sugar phosphate isomerase/epimerase